MTDDPVTAIKILSYIESRARDFAVVAHGDQKYGDGRPYVAHLDAVHQVAVDMEAPIAVRVAAYLHDVLEDTTANADNIHDIFGSHVLDLVHAVTNEKGKNRAERHALTYPKTRGAGDTAVLLKLCDRIANVENGGPLVKMYLKEQAAFREFFFPMGGEKAWFRLLNAFPSK